MMNYFYTNNGFGNSFGFPGFMHAFLPFMGLFLLWTLFWKGLGLWHAGRRGDAWWFVIMLVVNLLGIIEIVYLFGVAKLKVSELFSRGHHHNG